MFKQGKPDGPNDLYPVHMHRERTAREVSLCVNSLPVLCDTGSWHRWIATSADAVTCPRCLERLEQSRQKESNR